MIEKPFIPPSLKLKLKPAHLPVFRKEIDR